MVLVLPVYILYERLQITRKKFATHFDSLPWLLVYWQSKSNCIIHLRVEATRRADQETKKELHHVAGHR
jgi:hypothetical protein